MKKERRNNLLKLIAAFVVGLKYLTEYVIECTHQSFSYLNSQSLETFATHYIGYEKCVMPREKIRSPDAHARDLDKNSTFEMMNSR